jgi:hypothetical protein
MKKRMLRIFVGLLVLTFAAALMAADQRIQYNEYMVGANHPTKADTLNRLVLVEHNADGTHKTTVTIDNSIDDFRLTLTSGTPVTTSDVIGATNIYLTPYKGTRISLYNGTKWVIDTSGEVSLALSGLTFGSNVPYDIFCYDNGGVPTLEFLIWSSSTARATAIVLQDGVKVKSGAPTRRYLGCFIPVSATTTTDSVVLRYLENEYNRVDRPMVGLFSNNHSPSNTSYDEIGTEIEIKFVMGNNENPVWVGFIGGASNGTPLNSTVTAVAIDSTSVAQSGTEAVTLSSVTSNQQISASCPVSLAVGYHYVTLIGAVSGGTGTWNYQSAPSSGAVKCVLIAAKKG